MKVSVDHYRRPPLICKSVVPGERWYGCRHPSFSSARLYTTQVVVASAHHSHGPMANRASTCTPFASAATCSMFGGSSAATVRRAFDRLLLGHAILCATLR